jgi:hypothetical protein
MTVSEHPVGMTTCGTCAFWRRVGGSAGTCRRYAPAAGHGTAEVARWPVTRPIDFCGDGVVSAAAPGQTECRACRYWYQPAVSQGLNPMNRRDERKAWWDQAGFCVRHAPSPGLEPGYHGFWRATHAMDGCAEGTGEHGGGAS